MFLDILLNPFVIHPIYKAARTQINDLGMYSELEL